MSEAFNEAMNPTDLVEPTQTLSPERVATALAAAVQAFESRPANLRHPESKKVRCHQCRTRLTLADFRKHKHVIRDENFSITHKGRKNPHFSQRRLQLVQRVREIMPPIGDDFNAEDIAFLVKETRIKAAREIRKETEYAAKKKRQQQKASRRANRS